MKTILKRIAKLTGRLIPNFYFYSHKGFCPCCDIKTNFIAVNNSLRESFLCTNCLSNSRERALMLVLEKYFPNWKQLDIHESSPCNRGVSQRLRMYCNKYVSSQYYPQYSSGALINGSRNENLEKQTFEDASFDIVITLDVMEHVYNPAKAFCEISRTLRGGGGHIFTVPIANKHAKTEIWATQGENGQPIFLKTPEYHGNPIDTKGGSPCTMHYGYDIVDFIKEKSGLDTTIECISNIDFGIPEGVVEIFVSKKSTQ